MTDNSKQSSVPSSNQGTELLAIADQIETVGGWRIAAIKIRGAVEYIAFLRKRRGQLTIERDRAREALQAALEWAAPMGQAPPDSRPKWFDVAKAALAFRAERCQDETTRQPQWIIVGEYREDGTVDLAASKLPAGIKLYIKVRELPPLGDSVRPAAKAKPLRPCRGCDCDGSASRVEFCHRSAEIEAMRVAIYEKQNRWQPIDSCPKDGNPFLCGWWSPNSDYWWTVKAHWANGCVDGGWDGGRPPVDVTPTHWMPLPAPPSSAEKASEQECPHQVQRGHCTICPPLKATEQDSCSRCWERHGTTCNYCGREFL